MATTGGDSGRIWHTAIDADDATAKEPVGSIRVEWDSTYGRKVYMYVLASGTLAAGYVCTFKGATGYTVGVTSTLGTGGTVGQMKAVGVAIGAITDAQYGWIQIYGYCGTVNKHPTIHCCTTAYVEMVHMSGSIRSGKYINTTTWLTATTYHVTAGITALASKGTACTNCACFLHCM